MPPAPVDHSASEWRWLWHEVRPFWRYQATSVACILGLSTLSMGVPLLMKWLIDDVLPARRLGALALVGVLFFAFYAGRVLLGASAALISASGVQHVTLRLRRRLLARLQALPESFYTRHPVGDLVQRLERDVVLVGDLGSDVMPALGRMAGEALLTVTAMLVLDWRLSIVILPLLPLFVYVRRRYREVLRRSAEGTREAAGRQSSLLNEILTGATQVQLLGAERRLLRRYVRLNRVTMTRQMHQKRSEQLYTVAEMSVIGLGTALIVAYGGARVVSGDMTAGSLVAFYGYIGNLFSPMHTAVELHARMQRVRASIRRLMEIEEQQNTLADAPDAAPLTCSPQTLTFRGVSFGYSAEIPALRQVDFAARSGERIAIVGESGGGKSTLLRLVPRLYDAAEGLVEVDGQNVRSLRLRSLRSAISFVPQDPILFQGTLRDNLRHGCPAATQEDIATAAWIVCLTDVVDRLPNGWDTELGPMGAGLSGGERQRLAIMRALLQRRPVLILDEATSALDPPTEHKLLARLKRWCADRIVISAGHRLSNARWADRVIVMSRGAIAEEGSHVALQRPGTRYYDLWRREESQITDDAASVAHAPEHSRG